MKYLLILLLGWTSCTNTPPLVSKEQPVQNEDSIAARSLLKESFNQEDTIFYEDITLVLKPVGVNFRKLNSIPEGEWMSVVQVRFQEDSTSCEATFYRYVAKPDKIIVRKFAPGSQYLMEYYLLNGKLSLLREKEYEYATKEIYQTDSYFIDGSLRYQFDNQDCGAPNAESYTKEEEKRINAEFERIVSREKDNK